MPSPTKGPRLGGSPAHERLMLANLATALFKHGRITTTEAKAKRVRPLAERLVTFAKRGDLSSRRRVMTVIRDKGVVHVLFSEIGPRYDNRPGGYTRGGPPTFGLRGEKVDDGDEKIPAGAVSGGATHAQDRAELRAPSAFAGVAPHRPFPPLAGERADRVCRPPLSIEWETL